MGGLVIETIRPGVQFAPDAAKAFQRAEAQVQSEFGRNIDVNSTYRSWDKQMSMYNAWNAYVNGTGPYPGHSKAAHPMYSRHTNGTALDSDDWRNAHIRQILAENGFIRNQLHVPNEQHHFEYIRSKDKNYGKEIDVPLTSDEIKRIAAETSKQVWNSHKFKAYQPEKSYGFPAESAGMRLRRITDRAGRSLTIDRENRAELAALTAAVEALAKTQGGDPAAILKAVKDGVKTAMDKIEVTLSVDSE